MISRCFVHELKGRNMGLMETIIKKVLEKVTIIDKTKLSDSVYKIRIQSDSIANYDFEPWHFLRLGVGIGIFKNNRCTRTDQKIIFSNWSRRLVMQRSLCWRGLFL
jgi:hypothetical protein